MKSKAFGLVTLSLLLVALSTLAGLLPGTIPGSLSHQSVLAAANPDLGVVEKHETWVQPGISYTVSFTIRNTGNATASAGHDVGLRVDGKFIESKPVPVSLAPSANYTDNFTTVIPLSGSSDNVVLYADIYNEVAESNELNNRRGNTIAWPPAPDLIVGSNTYEEWTQAGSQYRIHFNIINRGNAPASANHSAALTVDGFELERKVIGVSLTPGISYTTNFTTLVTLSGGLDKVKVTADINNGVAESVETNNSYENTIAWPQAPDLTVWSKGEQWLPGSTTQYNVFFEIRNIGNAQAAAGHHVQLKVDGTEIEMAAVPEVIIPGSFYSATFSANVTISGSSDNITVTTDMHNDIIESDETNNSRWNVWSPVMVRINAPAEVATGSNFVATVNVTSVTNLDAANYDVSFNPTILRLDNVTSGNISGKTIPVDIWNQIGAGAFAVVQNLPGLTGVNGTGYLAVLHFSVIGSPGQSSNITLANGVLGNNLAQEIPATWVGVSLTVTTLATVEVNNRDRIILAPGQIVSATAATGIPVAVKGLPNLGAPANGLAGFTFNFTWNKNVIRVDSAAAATAATGAGWSILPGTPNNTNGTLTSTGFTTTYSTADVVLLYLGITAIGSLGDNTTIAVTIANLGDKDGNPIPALPVNAPVIISGLVAETGIAQGLSSNATGVVVVKVNINRIKNPTDNSTANITGGIGNYSATAGGNPGNAIQFLTVYGVPPFSGPSFNATTGIFSVPAVSSPIQPNNTTVAEVAPILTGNVTTSVTLTISFQTIGAAGQPGLNVPEEGSNSITLRRGNVKEDATVDIFDALFIAQYIVGQRTLSGINALNAASVKHDGAGGDKIDIFDALFIAQYIVGQRNAYFQ